MPKKSTTEEMKVDAEIGARVRMRRTQLNLSMEKLADTLGVTFQQVQKYESGKNRISGSRMQKIAEMLDVPVSFFFVVPGKEPAMPTLSEFEVKVLLALEGIKGASRQNHMLAVIRLLASQ